MNEVRLTRVYRFSSSHRLHSPLLTKEDNCLVYGKCNNPFGHGHDYVLEVAIAGRPAPATGRLLPLAQLDAIVGRAVVEPMDRRDLNTEVAEFSGELVPTTENLALVVASRLAVAWQAELASSPARLVGIRIHETPNNIFEVSAEKTS